MTYPKSGSLLGSNINSNLSTQITIKVGNTTIGAIQTLTVNQNRDMSVWEEVGTDGIVEIHPKGATKIEIEVTRVVFDQLRLTESFARGYINIQAQRFPFDIQVIDNDSSLTAETAVVHTYHNCWFRRYSPTYRADNFIISETASITAERATTMRGSQSAAFGGARGISVEVDSMERATDVLGIPGRMDSSGFIARPLGATSSIT